MTDVPTVEVSGLAYAYPDGHQALFGVDLRLRRGEHVALLGPNGAGKTTLALHLNGLLHPGAGTVRVGGVEIDERTAAEVRGRVGILFQDPDDQLFMPTVARDVAFGPANQGLRGEALQRRVDAALDAVGLTELGQRPPHHLSFGQRRRAALAGVLAMRPELLVLDEPSSNLDPAARADLVELLQRTPVTLLVVTHDLPLAAELCERSVVMSAGRIVADAPTGDLLRDEDLLRRHRLRLPFGFDARALAAGIAGRGQASEGG
jgi:cobalt/nickel transport system ATP-binding protein